MKNNMNTKTMNTGMNTNNTIETKEEIVLCRAFSRIQARKVELSCDLAG